MMEIQLHDTLVCRILDQEMSVLEVKYKGQDEWSISSSCGHGGKRKPSPSPATSSTG
jgi:hypothetical protein